MRKHIFIIIALVTLFSSCQKDEIINDDNNKRIRCRYLIQNVVEKFVTKGNSIMLNDDEIYFC